MKKYFSSLIIFLCLTQLTVQAEDKSLEDQIAEVKELVEQEKINNVELKAKIAARRNMDLNDYPISWGNEMMKNKCNYMFSLILAIPMNIHAQEMTLQEQIDEIKEQIQHEISLQTQLRTDLDAKDAEVAELRKKLEELENKLVIGD